MQRIYLRKHLASLLVLLLCPISNALCQKSGVVLQIPESFFNEVLAAAFRKQIPLEFSIANFRIADEFRNSDELNENAEVNRGNMMSRPREIFSYVSLLAANKHFFGYPDDSFEGECRQTVRMIEFLGDERTRVIIKPGTIRARMAFSGNTDVPFVGCLPFNGIADALITPQLDQASRTIVARIEVESVELNGTAGVGSTLIAKLVQSSIDKKLNPLQLAKLDSIGFDFPIAGSSIKLQPGNVIFSAEDQSLKIYIDYSVQ